MMCTQGTALNSAVVVHLHASIDDHMSRLKAFRDEDVLQSLARVQEQARALLLRPNSETQQRAGQISRTEAC